MKIQFKYPETWVLTISIFFVILGILFQVLPSFSQAKETDKNLEQIPIPKFVIVQNNTLTSLYNPGNKPKIVKKVQVVVTAYSSTPWETDNNPFITASGKQVKEGIVANNKYPFGTKLRFPEIYGDQIFVVEDRMHWRKNPYQFDIWMDSNKKAKTFGVKITEVEILKTN